MAEKKAIKKLSEAIYKRTVKAYGAFFEQKDIKISEKSKKLIDIIEKKGLSKYRKALLQIFSLHFKEPDLMRLADAEKAEMLSSFYSGTILVPIREYQGSHDYPLDKPMLVRRKGGRDGQTGMRIDGSRGNTLTIYVEYLRMPTQEEVTEFVTKNYRDIMKIAPMGILDPSIPLSTF